jgi:hypothetical protein
MPYREAAAGPEEEILDSFELLTSAGELRTGIFGGLAVFFAVGWVISLVTKLPLGGVPGVFIFSIVMAAFTVVAVVSSQRRKRELRIVRTGDRIRLVVGGDVDLVFPLALSGRQWTTSMRFGSILEASLKAVDPQGGSIVVHETRGAIQNKLHEWFTKLDDAPTGRAYDVRSPDELPRLRARIEEINGKDPRDVT